MLVQVLLLESILVVVPTQVGTDIHAELPAVAKLPTNCNAIYPFAARATNLLLPNATLVQLVALGKVPALYQLALLLGV